MKSEATGDMGGWIWEELGPGVRSKKRYLLKRSNWSIRWTGLKSKEYGQEATFLKLIYTFIIIIIHYHFICGHRDLLCSPVWSQTTFPLTVFGKNALLPLPAWVASHILVMLLPSPCLSSCGLPSVLVSCPDFSLQKGSDSYRQWQGSR